ncbi:carbon-monoxide dehydrogenase large subunit [Aquamicrobium terrae]
MEQVSRRVPLTDGVAKVTGRLSFAADMAVEGLVHGALLLSPRAHARIVSLDATAALSLPGVIGVWWHANTPQNGYNSSIWYCGQVALADERMFPPVVRHVGDRVAVVLAETEAIARAALMGIAVEYEDLPAVLTPQDALGHAGPVADAGGPTYRNPVDEVVFVHGDPEAAFARADHVAEVAVRTPRSHHCAVEPHVCLAWPEAGGRIAVHSPCQSVFAVQAVVAQALAMDPARLHVTKAPIGGSFGGKAEPILDPICAYLAGQAGRPVRLALNRRETFIATRTRSAVTGRMRIALSADGHILGRDTDVVVDIGAYCTGGNYLPGSMLQRLARLYDVPAERYRGRAVYTNTLPTGAFRGYGSPQIHAVGEIALDLALRDMGLDPVEARIANIVAPGAQDPWQGLDLGNARGADCLTRGAEAFKWAERRAACAGKGRFRRGVGMAAATHINGCFPGDDEATTATLRLRTDGRADLVCALHDLGCGSDTSLAQIAAEVLGLRAGEIVIAPADTDACAYDLGTRASRMTYIAGEAVRRAALALAAAIADAAALALNAAPGEISLRGGRAEAAHASMTLAELAGWLATRGTVLPAATHTHRASANPGSYAAHFAEVEVDTLTGRVQVSDYLAVHDVGRAINPMLVEGQIHGGVQIGIGYALYEDVAMDADTGRILADSFARYTLVNAPEMPPLRVLLVEEGEPTGPFGAKAIGEIATIPVAPAIVNAVNRALGTRLTDLPLLPDRIVAALHAGPQGR